MITGMHAIIYSREAESLRRFIDEIFDLDSVDAGGGWPIFAAPPTELAVHETDNEPDHELFLICDDVAAAVEKLQRIGIETSPIEDRGWGLLTTLELPGGESIGLYEPRHPSPHRRKKTAARKRARKAAEKRSAPARKKRTAPARKAAKKRSSSARKKRRR